MAANVTGFHQTGAPLPPAYDKQDSMSRPAFSSVSMSPNNPEQVGKIEVLIMAARLEQESPPTSSDEENPPSREAHKFLLRKAPRPIEFSDENTIIHPCCLACACACSIFLGLIGLSSGILFAVQYTEGGIE